jgi:WD40 repeat protein
MIEAAALLAAFKTCDGQRVVQLLAEGASIENIRGEMSSLSHSAKATLASSVAKHLGAPFTVADALPDVEIPQLEAVTHVVMTTNRSDTSDISDLSAATALAAFAHSSIATGHADGALCVSAFSYRDEIGEGHVKRRVAGAHKGAISCITASHHEAYFGSNPSEAALATYSAHDSTINVWAADLRCVKSISVAVSVAEMRIVEILKHSKEKHHILAVACSSSSTDGVDGSIQLWNLTLDTHCVINTGQ